MSVKEIYGASRCCPLAGCAPSSAHGYRRPGPAESAAGLLRDAPHHVPRRCRAERRSRRHARPRALPDRRRHHHRHRGAARRRCGRRLLDHDLRRTGGRHRGGGERGRRAGSGGDGRADHEHPGTGAAGAQGGRDRRRLPSDLAAVLLCAHRRRLLRSRRRRRCRVRRRPGGVQHPLEHAGSLARPRRPAVGAEDGGRD